MLHHKCEALAGEIGLGVLVDSWIAFLFEEPLTEILLIAGFGPAVVVYVEDLLFLALLLCRRRRLAFLALSCFWLFGNYWLLEVKGLVVAFRFLCSPYSKVSNWSDVLLNPVEIFANQILLVLAIVANDNISKGALPHKVSNILDAKLIEIEEGEVVPNRQVLIQERRIVLD